MNNANEDPSEKLAASPGHTAVPGSPLSKRTIPSEDILAGEKEIWIQHGEAIYRLCETKSGKLILQK
ncbi:hemin uptake protein HemP [bacterium]|nr:hemin uptake protein HemP [bacterium]